MRTKPTETGLGHFLTKGHDPVSCASCHITLDALHLKALAALITNAQGKLMLDGSDPPWTKQLGDLSLWVKQQQHRLGKKA